LVVKVKPTGLCSPFEPVLLFTKIKVRVNRKHVCFPDDVACAVPTRGAVTLKCYRKPRTPARYTQAEINRANPRGEAGDDAFVELRDGVIHISFNGKKRPPDDEADGGDVIL
jgi:hypothetical protein